MQSHTVPAVNAVMNAGVVLRQHFLIMLELFSDFAARFHNLLICGRRGMIRDFFSFVHAVTVALS